MTQASGRLCRTWCSKRRRRRRAKHWPGLGMPTMAQLWADPTWPLQKSQVGSKLRRVSHCQSRLSDTKAINPAKRCHWQHQSAQEKIVRVQAPTCCVVLTTHFQTVSLAASLLYRHHLQASQLDHMSQTPTRHLVLQPKLVVPSYHTASFLQCVSQWSIKLLCCCWV